MTRLVCGLSLASLLGCGGGSVTHPTYELVGPVVRVVSGANGLPVAGARIASDSSRAMLVPPITTNSTGQAQLLSFGAIEIDAPAFLERKALVGAAGDYTLWPQSDPTGLDEEATRQLAYGGGELLHWLWRLAERPVTLVPSADILANHKAMTALEAASIRFQAVTGFDVTIDTRAVPGSSVVEVTYNPDDPCGGGTLACSYLQFSGDWILGAKIVLKRRGQHPLYDTGEWYPLLLHELGHVYGLNHSYPGSKDVMSPGWLWVSDYSAREQLVMRLMAQRAPGNRYPDTDSGAVRGLSTSRARRVVVVPCGDS